MKILRIDRDTVKLGIQAPAQLPVHRQEIHDAIVRSHAGANSSPVAVPAPNGSHAAGPNGNGPLPPR